MSAVVLAVIEACSFFIPFDDYPGNVVVVPDAPLTTDGEPADAGADVAVNACADADLLSDPSNCGICNRACVEGVGSCVDGKCPKSVVYDPDGGSVVTALAITSAPDPDAGSVLYMTNASAFLVRKSLTTDAVERVPTGPGQGPRAIAVTRTLGVFARGTANVDRFKPSDLDALDASAFESIAAGRTGLGPVALLGSTPLWGENAGTFWLEGDAATGGVGAGADEAVAFRTSRDIVTWVTSTGAVQTSRVGSFGTITTLLPAGTGTYSDLEVSASYLYLCRTSGVVAAQGGVVIYTTTNPPTLAKTLANIRLPQAIAATAAHIYVADWGKGSKTAQLWRARVDGSQAVVIADGLELPRALALDGPWVYFNDGPRVLRTSK